MEKIRSGQAYLYRAGGLNSTVLEVQMKSNIEGIFLCSALDKSLLRYPYMTSKLVEKNGNFFIEENLIPMAAVKTSEYRSLGSASTGYHLIDVTYTENKIRVAFHHALCDGLGIKPFVETLIYYYCCLRYNESLDATGIRLVGEPLLPGETTEPLGHTPYAIDENKLPKIVKDGYILPEHAEEVTHYYRHEININKAQFMAYAKAHNATPAILLSLLASSTIKSLYPDGDTPIVCSMATDYRKDLGLDNTHKNCVGSIYLPYTQEIQELSLSQQTALYRNMMKEQRSPDAVKSAVNMQINLFGKLDQMKSMEAKKQMMSFLNNIRIDTYVISYLGQMQLGGSAQYVESVHLYSSGTKGLILNMISAGNCITVDILQSFQSEKFVSAFFNTLDTLSIAYTKTNAIAFETAKDNQ